MDDAINFIYDVYQLPANAKAARVELYKKGTHLIIDRVIGSKIENINERIPLLLREASAFYDIEYSRLVGAMHQ